MSETAKTGPHSDGGDMASDANVASVEATSSGNGLLVGNIPVIQTAGHGSSAVPSSRPQGETSGGQLPRALSSEREVEDEIIAHFADLAEMLALPKSYGQIYGLLFISARPLSFTDIVERLDLSKGAISIGLKALREVGAIHPADGPDWRRDHFVAETNLRRLIGGYMKESIQPRLLEGAKQLKALRARHRGTLRCRTERSRLLQDRLQRLQMWQRQGNMLLPVIAKFLG